MACLVEDLSEYQNSSHKQYDDKSQRTSVLHELVPRENETIFEVKPFYPPGVTEIIAFGFDCYIGRISATDGLKYLHDQPDEIMKEQAQAILQVEAQLYAIIGDHDHIIKFLGSDANGLRLEFAQNGSVANYLKEAKTTPTIRQKLQWSRQAAEGLAHIHSKNVIHCDINTNNLLLDRDLNIKIADFQGHYLDVDGSKVLDGFAAENSKSSMPRRDPDKADQKTDMFALGSAMYNIMTGQEVFPDLDTRWDDEANDEVQRRFSCGEFPTLSPELGGKVIDKCWRGLYVSASEIVEDVEDLLASRVYDENEITNELEDKVIKGS